MRSNIPTLLAVLALGALFASASVAQDLVIYPKGGQDAEQQKKDEYECHEWAVGQSGFDPINAPSAADAVPAEAKKGGLLRGGAKGAAGGAVIGAIAGDAGKGAAIGAAGGAIVGNARRNNQVRDQEATQQQAQANIDAQRASYTRAKKTCLEGRNYSVN
jgi:hypothetical protein